MSARIVVVDDEPDIRRLICFTLRRRGYDVVEDAAGDTGLETIRHVMPDLVVLDVMLPGLSGVQVAAALRSDEATAHIPVLLVSANGQSADIAKGLAAGAKAYLVKPFAPQELARTVESLLAPA
jgi:DNA-binding response OmpR family regulator